MPMLAGGPPLHRKMARQRDFPVVKKRKSRRTMRQPANVLRCLAEQGPFPRDHTLVKCGADRLKKCKNDALGGSGLEEFVVFRLKKISDEETRSGFRPAIGRSNESIPAQGP